MSKYIEVRNIDFQQIFVDNVAYEIETMKTINNKVHLIYKPMNKDITSIKISKDKTKIIYKFIRSD